MLIEQMDSMDKQFNESVTSLSANMKSLTESISDGFTFLKMMFMAPSPLMYPSGPMVSHPPHIPPAYDTTYSQSSNPHFRPGHSQPHRLGNSSYQEEYGLED